jgi:hypothetical protein
MPKLKPRLHVSAAVVHEGARTDVDHQARAVAKISQIAIKKSHLHPAVRKSVIPDLLPVHQSSSPHKRRAVVKVPRRSAAAADVASLDPVVGNSAHPSIPTLRSLSVAKVAKEMVVP